MELDQQQLAHIKERLYFVRWTFNNYYKENDKEPRLETFQWNERQKALERYLELEGQLHAQDVKFQVAQPQDVNVVDFINSF